MYLPQVLIGLLLFIVRANIKSHPFRECSENTNAIWLFSTLVKEYVSNVMCVCYSRAAENTEAVRVKLFAVLK